MTDDETVVLISAIEHHVYCPRQCALIHVDGSWIDNRDTIAGRQAHRRADSGSHRIERGKLVVRSLALWSERYGLSGRADIIEFSEGSVSPVEYKASGRYREATNQQICAQALCLEEMFGVPVETGWIWSGATRRRSQVAIDSTLRQRTIETIAAIRESITTGELPEAVNDARCEQCQFLPRCLPSVVADPRRVREYVQNEVFL